MYGFTTGDCDGARAFFDTSRAGYGLGQGLHVLFRSLGRPYQHLRHPCANFIGNVGGKLVTGQEITWRTTGQDLQDAAVAGLVGTGITGGAGSLGDKVLNWSRNSGKRAAEEVWAPGAAIGTALDSGNLTGKIAMGGVSSAGGQAAADGVDMWEGQDKDFWRDVGFSGAAGAAAGGANHVGDEVHNGGGKHRATDREGFPGWQQVPVDGAIYGAGNAINTETTDD
ncbi:hypothetical protein [Streptomyces mooreae]|uniref:hypothetical protein n=1 Tax=Streptomyces mooreae TaxID=3075523 RepID=UPI00288B191C|nr:hypothetical protein [Streptomyces sp. DSM 41527]